MTATCACGNTTISVKGQPTLHSVCHCTNCKRRTGSAFGVSAYFEKSAVIDRQGQTCVYAFHHVAQNHDQERHFCPSCGTTLFWYVSALPDKIGVAGGCFGEADMPEPTTSITDAKKKAWVSLPPTWTVCA